MLWSECPFIDESLLSEAMPQVNGRSFKPSLLKQSKPPAAYQPLIDSPSSPCRPANLVYWHSLTGTWERIGSWTCLTWIRVRAGGRGWGCLFLCVLDLHILQHGSCSAVFPPNQWQGVQNLAWNGIDWFLQFWCHVHWPFLICTTFHSMLSLPKSHMLFSRAFTL